MAGSKVLLKIIIFAIFTLTYLMRNVTWASRLNVPRILLPVFNDFPVNFTLDVTEGGCYQWSTSRLDVVHLIPINENSDRTCSSAVIVQSATRDSTRNTAIVLAEDINTGQFLRCVVIVDAIFSLNLVTTTRELFIEEAPEAFEVRAYDEQGNEFTTLAGVEFTWTIGNRDKYSTHSNLESSDNILRFMTFQESPYETPSTIATLDRTGRKGSIILMEGVKTGTAKVSAKLPYSEYKNVPPVEVELIVIANLIILPTDVTMMAYDSLKYRIMQVHQGRLEEIQLPSNQYFLDAENSEILDIDNGNGKAYALGHGRTKVLLHDKNVDEEYGVVLPTATVHINNVEYITITVLPDRNRGLILGETHEIIVELFDVKDHKFYIGDGVQVSIDIDQQYFDIKMKTHNGTHIVVVPTICGTTNVEAQLYGVIDKNGRQISLETPLIARAELVIHTPVIVSPQVLAVPWDPKSKSRLDVAMKANGGDGTYVWTSRQSSVATVNQNGVVRILNHGTSDVIVSMARNQFNYDRARVYVMLPSRLEIIQYNMDAATGEPIHLHIALYGKTNETPDSKEIPFTDCHDTSFEVYISDNYFTRNNTNDNVQPIGIACTTLTIIGTDVGSTSVTVAYSANGQYLMDNVTVSAYESLIPIHPSTAETLLAVGSSRNIIFKGGPHPSSISKLQNFNREFLISDNEIIHVSEHDNKNENSIVSIFEVTCRALGEVIFTFKISSEPLLPNCRTTGAISKVKIICGKPRYINLHVELNDNKNCPIGNNVDKIMAHSDKPLRLIVTVKDEDGKSFDNITSLNVEWSIKPPTSGIIEISSGVIEETFIDFDVVLPKNHYQTIIPKKYARTIGVSAKITDYQKYILAKLRIAPEWPPFPITTERGTLATPRIATEINIYLVNDTIITPSKIKILNDPNAKYSLQVNQGSGYYEFVLSTDDIADIRYVEPTKTISVIPKKSGILQLALVDLCIISTPAVTEIEVQQLATIEITNVNKVEKGKCIIATIKLYDTNGHLIELPSLEVLDLKAQIDNNFIEIKRLPMSEQGDSPYSQILFMIYGMDEGESKLNFISGHGENEVRSDTSVIQVFMPLRIAQRNVTILVGTVYQIMTIGGPPNTQIEFNIDNDNVASIDNNGICEGKTIGNTKVVVNSIGPDTKGNRVVYSHDEVNIHVTHLEGIRIVTPTTRIKIGATIPLWAFGVPDHLTPLIIGSMKSLLVFTWFTCDTTMINLHNMYEGTGINIRYQNEVTLRAKALNPGSATIYLNVTIPPMTLMTGYKDDVTFSTFIKIEIIEELTLINPELVTGLPIISMAPNSTLKLTTNRENYGVSTYKIIASGQSSESEDSNALIISKTVTIDKNGVIKSGDILGRTILSITNIESYNRKQSLTVIVDVKPIHYMMISLSSNVRIRNGEELNILPKGMELNYIIEYFDIIGNKFHAGEINFNTIANRADLVTFTAVPPNYVTVKFNENGELVAKVYSEKYQNGIFDYAHMMIGDILFPSKTVLTIGDIVCFSMPLLSSENSESGYWQSSMSDVLYVDAITGIGIAKNPGQVIVKHSLTNNKYGEIEVTVQPICKISLVMLRGKNITGNEIFSVPLVLKSKDEGIKENNVLARGLGGCRTRKSFTLDSYPFTCSIQFIIPLSSINIKDLFIAKPRFDIVTGFYYCDIIPIGIPTMTSSTLETRIVVNAHSRDVEGKPLEINYLPPIYVPITEIIFTKTSQVLATALLQIYGLHAVLEHVSLNVPDGVVINVCELATTTMLQYNLRLMQNRDDIQGQKLIIFNELTRQNITLPIRLSRHGEFTPLSGINWIDGIFFHRYSLLTFAIIIVTIYYMWKRKVSCVDLSVRNTSVFADKCPPPLRKSPQPCLNASLNNTINTSSPRQLLDSPLRPFSAFEPVYGDPRGFYTPNARRNICYHST